MKIKYISPKITIETLTLSTGIAPISPIVQQNKNNSAIKRKIRRDNGDTPEGEDSEN